MEETQAQHYKSAIEALLFVSDKPVVLDQFKQVFPELRPSDIEDLTRQLQDEYVNRNAGMMVVEIAGGWQMLSNSHAASYIREFYKTRAKEKLSRPALECLAIIAYKQPVGRGDVEVIRGVNSDGTIAHLLNKGLVKIVGRKEVPGRPFIYGTTKEFLEYFGLRALEDLPKIEELSLAEPVAAGENPTDIVPMAPEPGIEAGLAAASQESSGQSRVSEPQSQVAAEEPA